MSRDLLMIAYLFPPIGGSGAIRPLKLCRYLPRFGWRPVILTVRNPDWYYARNEDLLAELPRDVRVFRSVMLRSAWIYRLLNPLRIKRLDDCIRRYLMHPDERIGWLVPACRQAMKIIKSGRIEAVYSTSGPLTCHLIAWYVKARTGLPWVAEFRDEWLEEPSLALPTRWHYRLHFFLERQIVRRADRVVTLAPAFTRFLSKHVETVEKFITVPAGFDPADFSAIHGKTHRGPFTIVFTGLFYDNFKPDCFLSAVNDLLNEKKISSREIVIRFVGANTADQLDVSDVHGIWDFTGFVGRKQALAYLNDADVALLLLSRERGAGVIPSKLFDYIAAQIPILALVPPEGAAAEIISATGSGLIVDFGDKSQIKESVYQLFLAWKENRPLIETRVLPSIDQYRINRLVGKLAETLNQVAGR